ncbi:MAG TPA: hypothetical protein VJS64_20345 [Pyrinomonadaceae bacterium]|nr:hypothetical protein [Pyrinomonadaceae bacterium]
MRRAAKMERASNFAGGQFAMLKAKWIKRLVAAAGLFLFAMGSVSVAQTQSPQLSPSDTVRSFYRMMREKKFREAFALSIYRPAIDPLTPAEFDDLRPDFEKMAAAIPEQVNISGEQISGEIATVFVKVKDDENKDQADKITLIMSGGFWIVGEKENEKIVKDAGKRFFFDARINVHHHEVQTMLTRISLAQLLYSQQHAGKFADMPTLILGGLVPKDIEGTDSTGYRFRVTASADGKSWNAAAEPAQYGRTGKLSFYMDASGVRSGDVGGKPLPTPRN